LPMTFFATYFDTTALLSLSRPIKCYLSFSSYSTFESSNVRAMLESIWWMVFLNCIHYVNIYWISVWSTLVSSRDAAESTLDPF
jgi:hypothetical protein